MPDRVYTLEICAEPHQTTQDDASAASVQEANAIRLVVPSGVTQPKLRRTLWAMQEAIRRDPHMYEG